MAASRSAAVPSPAHASTSGAVRPPTRSTHVICSAGLGITHQPRAQHARTARQRILESSEVSERRCVLQVAAVQGDGGLGQLPGLVEAEFRLGRLLARVTRGPATSSSPASPATASYGTRSSGNSMAAPAAIRHHDRADADAMRGHRTCLSRTRTECWTSGTATRCTGRPAAIRRASRWSGCTAAPVRGAPRGCATTTRGWATRSCSTTSAAAGAARPARSIPAPTCG